MIFYFSGTGNSAWVARQLARLTRDEAYDITDLSELPDMDSAKQIGFVFPVYTWGAPEVMGAFVKKLPRPQAFTFGVCTCGSDAGLAMKQIFPKRKALLCRGQLQWVRAVREKLPGPYHYAPGGQARLGGTVLSVPALHQRMPQTGHPIRKGHSRSAPLHHPGLSAPGRAMR